jgi:hypothetical protein
MNNGLQPPPTPVQQWQTFLKQHGNYDGEVDGQFGPRTKAATKQFQEKHNEASPGTELRVTGVADPQTLSAAANTDNSLSKLAALPGSLKRTAFVLGPDREDDLREARPYFLLPLDDKVERSAALERIANHVKAAEAYTDVFVISHGWHRNFYDAVSGYDRMISRFFTLVSRGRIQPPHGFNPLFITPHWHSDPGPEGFYDVNGRKHKASFLERAEQLFVRQDGEAIFTNDFEDIFEFLSSLAAPSETDKINDPDSETKARELSVLLSRYGFRDARFTSTLESKTAAVWRCYNESTSKGLVLDQLDPPGTSMPIGQAIKLFASFLVPALPLSMFFPGIRDVVLRFVRVIAGLGWPLVLMLLVGVFLLSWIYLAQSGRGRNAYPKSGHLRRSRGLTPITALAWMVMEIPLGLIVLVFCLFTYFPGRNLGRSLLWDERPGTMDCSRPDAVKVRKTPREAIIGLARYPVHLVMRATATDGFLYGLAVKIDQQLAVAEMQRHAVIKGIQLASSLTDLYAKDPTLREARLHLIGHSFGGLSVSNAARCLAHNPDFVNGRAKIIKTLAVIQGAFASAWFEKESPLMGLVDTLAAVYTRYDTATGFIYSFGFQARRGIGSVGLYLGPNNPVRPVGHKGEFASVTEPPIDLIKSEATRNVCGLTNALNIDASRFEYEGPPLSGGAHSDIFKDDLVNLLWAVTTL